VTKVAVSLRDFHQENDHNNETEISRLMAYWRDGDPSAELRRHWMNAIYKNDSRLLFFQYSNPAEDGIFDFPSHFFKNKRKIIN